MRIRFRSLADEAAVTEAIALANTPAFQQLKSLELAALGVAGLELLCAQAKRFETLAELVFDVFLDVSRVPAELLVDEPLRLAAPDFAQEAKGRLEAALPRTRIVFPD